MNCEEARHILSLDCWDEIPIERLLELHQHLARCACCTVFVKKAGPEPIRDDEIPF